MGMNNEHDTLGLMLIVFTGTKQLHTVFVTTKMKQGLGEFYSLEPKLMKKS